MYSVCYILNHSINFGSFVASSWVLALDTEPFYEYFFWIKNYLIMKLGQPMCIVMNNKLGNILHD